MPDETTPQPSPGAQFIIDEAMKDDPRPLYVAFLGPLTDMAAALLMEPRLNERNVIVVWIGGGQWPVGGREFNLSNDIHAANVVMKSKVQVWQIPMTVYRMMAVGYAELNERVYDKGAIGKYLVEQLVEWNLRSTCWSDRASIAWRHAGASVILNPNGGVSEWLPAPEFNSLDGLRSYRREPADQGLPHHRHSLHPGGFLRQAVPLHPRRTGIGQLRLSHSKE